MAFDADAVFRLLREAYASGLLDQLLSVSGEALDGLIRETGLSTGELLALVDSIPAERIGEAESRVAAMDPAQALKDTEAFVQDHAAAVSRLQASLARAVASTQEAGEVQA